MSELKATPGPWSIYNMVHAETGNRMTPEEIGEYVANAVRARPECDDFLFISALVDGVPKDVCHVGNGEAGPYNAVLMAASHDLYDSLKALLDALDDNGSCQYEALREEGRDALAKSRGES